mmetsp:Transcript_3289/g.5876  ORF Transcript_3289/g.5876 Transcript_3289/m.5876 type:complete len:214 (+) Transcript_3289:313-954(+)
MLYLFWLHSVQGCILLLPVTDGPIKSKVVQVTLAKIEILQQLSQVNIIRAILETQAAAVMQIACKLWWIMLAEGLDWNGHLLLPQLNIFETLPRQIPTIEIHQHITHSLQVIPSALLNTKLRIDTRISCCAYEAFPFTIRNVLLRLRVSKSLRKSEINYANQACHLAQANTEITWLDISMDEILAVHILETIDHLISQHQHGLWIEPVVAESK